MLTFPFMRIHVSSIACPVGSFGYDCQAKCSVHCAVPDRCDRVTGECEDGCQPGWKGVTCDKRKRLCYVISDKYIVVRFTLFTHNLSRGILYSVFMLP